MAWWEAGARILLAILIGLAIGYERERRNKPAGTRTHILVCLGAALIWHTFGPALYRQLQRLYRLCFSLPIRKGWVRG